MEKRVATFVTVTIVVRGMAPIGFKMNGEANTENLNEIFENLPELIWFTNFDLCKNETSTENDIIFNLIPKKIGEHEAISHVQKFASITLSPFNGVECGKTVSSWIMNNCEQVPAKLSTLSQPFPHLTNNNLIRTIQTLDFQEDLSDFEVLSGVVAKFSISLIDTPLITVLVSSDGYYTENNPKHYVSLHLLISSLSPSFAKEFPNYAQAFCSLNTIERTLYHSSDHLFASSNCTATKLQSYQGFIPGSLDDQLEGIHFEQLFLSPADLEETASLSSMVRFCEERQKNLILKGLNHIMDEKILPFNENHNFIWNDLFFAPMNSLFLYNDCGGYETSDKTADHEIHILPEFLKIDPTIRIVRTVIVDYFTQRWFIQGVMPGFVSGNVSYLYGIPQNTEQKVFQCNERFTKYFELASEKFGIAKSPIISSETPIPSCSETTGIMGNDGRLYAIDFHRITPRDANYPKLEEQWAVIRQEAIRIYSDFLILEAHKSELSRFGVARENLYYPRGSNPAARETIAKILAENSRPSQISEESQNSEFSPNPKLVFDVNALTKDSKTAQTLQTCPQNIKDIATFIKTLLIPQFCSEFLAFYPMIIDGRGLTEEMHKRGINARYLGDVYNHLPKSATGMKLLVETEIIARSIKRIARLNVLPLSSLLPLINDLSPSVDSQFWEKLAQESKSHFGFTPHHPTLNSLALKLRVLQLLGLSLDPLQCNFISSSQPQSQNPNSNPDPKSTSNRKAKTNSKTQNHKTNSNQLNNNVNINADTDIMIPITIDSITKINSTMKYPEIKSEAIIKEVEKSIECYDSGKTEEALLMIKTTIDLVEKAFGAVSNELAMLYKYEALSLMKIGKFGEALGAAHRSAVIFEKIRSEIDPEVIFAFTLLGDCAARMGETKLAFAYAARAALVAGTVWRFFPWTIKAVINAANMAETVEGNIEQTTFLAKLAVDITTENGADKRAIAKMLQLAQKSSK